MPQPQTLAKLVGLELAPARLEDSVLLMIDCQNTYLDGPMKLVCVERAFDEVRRVLDRARRLPMPIIHIAHDAGPGSLYDVRGESGAIASPVAADGQEPTVIKNYPNAFTQTDLHERLETLGARQLIVVGFMTHMCVSSTVRGAFDHGYPCTVVGSATATRDLPAPDGQIVVADSLQRASLSALSDLCASVVGTVDDLPA